MPACIQRTHMNFIYNIEKLLFVYIIYIYYNYKKQLLYIVYKTCIHSCVCLCFTYRITGHWFHFQHTMYKLILKHYTAVHQFKCVHSLAHNQDGSNFVLLQFCHFSHHTEQGGSRRWTSCGPAPNVVQDRLHRGTGKLQCVSKSHRQLSQSTLF